MSKFHNYISCITGIGFLIVLQSFAVPTPVFRFLVPAFFVFGALVTYYNYWYLKKIGKYNIWTTLRPLMLFGSGFGLFIIIPNDFLRGSFLILMVILGSFFELFIGDFSENILLNETLLVAFSWFLFLFAYDNPYAPPFHTYYLIVIFFVCFVLVRSFYEFIPQTTGYKVVSAVAISLFCTELFWALTFLPFHFSVLAVMLLNFFYFFLILNYYVSYQVLSFKKIKFHVLLMVISTAVILITTPWKIIH